MQILVHLHVNKMNFYMKGFALGIALKQRRKATRKLPITVHVPICSFVDYCMGAVYMCLLHVDRPFIACIL